MNPLLKLEKAWKEVTDLFDKTYFTYEDGDVAHGDWIAEEFGSTYDINGYFFSGGDIITALRLKIPSGTLFKWYDDTLDAHSNRGECERCKGYLPLKTTVPNLKHFYWMTEENFSKNSKL